MTRSRAACGCISDDAFANDAVGVDGGESEFELARFDLAEIEQVVGETHHVAAGSVDVLEIVLVALVADRAETLLQHHFRKAQNGVQGRADLVADLGEKIGLGGARGLGGLARGDQAPFGVALAAEVAHESAKLRALRWGRSAPASAPTELKRRCDRARPPEADERPPRPRRPDLRISSLAVVSGWLCGASSINRLSPAISF